MARSVHRQQSGSGSTGRAFRSPTRRGTRTANSISEVYLSRDYAPLEKRLKGYLGYARGIPRIAADIRANLKMPLPKSLLERGIDAFGGFAQFYRNDVSKVFASVQDPEAQKDLAAADTAAAKAMDDLKAWLVSQRKTATDAFALGDPLFHEMLEEHGTWSTCRPPTSAAIGRARTWTATPRH